MFGSMMYADKDITVTELSSIDESKVDNLMKETLKDADDTGDFSKAVPKMKNILKAVTGKSGVSGIIMTAYYTRKNTQLVTNLQQTCSKLVGISWLQDLFALLVPSLQQTCYKLDELNGLVTSCSNNLLSGCKSTSCE